MLVACWAPWKSEAFNHYRDRHSYCRTKRHKRILRNYFYSYIMRQLVIISSANNFDDGYMLMTKQYTLRLLQRTGKLSNLDTINLFRSLMLLLPLLN